MLKRFLSTDPIGISGSLNGFDYTSGNPISYSDPNGLRTQGEEPDAWKRIGKIGKRVCKVVGIGTEELEEANKESQQRATDLYQSNMKRIAEAYWKTAENCMLIQDQCKFQQCLQNANDDRRRREEAEWEWYQRSWTRDQTPVEKAASWMDRACIF
jgi:hypothetical protein